MNVVVLFSLHLMNAETGKHQLNLLPILLRNTENSDYKTIHHIKKWYYIVSKKNLNLGKRA